MLLEGRVVTFGEVANVVDSVIGGKEAAKPDEKVAKVKRIKRDENEVIVE